MADASVEVITFRRGSELGSIVWWGEFASRVSATNPAAGIFGIRKLMGIPMPRASRILQTNAGYPRLRE